MYLMHFCTREENEKHLISNERVRFFFFFSCYNEREPLQKKKKKEKGEKRHLAPLPVLISR